MEKAIDYTQRLLRGGARPQKSLGQNFLIDDNVIEQIVLASKLEADTLLVEIGPGLGILTRVLAKQVSKMWAVELDGKKIGILQRELKGLPVEIINRDALKLDLADLWGERKGYLIGNLPYYITSPLIMHFLNQSNYLTGMTIMVQEEVADRLAAGVGGKEYGVLSVAVQIEAEVEKLIKVPAEAFWPRPKVNSALVRLQFRSYPGIIDKNSFMKIVKAGFSQRRKTLANSLAAGLQLSKEFVSLRLLELGIDDKRRAETISIEEFIRLTDVLCRFVK
ncbi:MAG TPA: 16S rRNA (adenine(1518)-N(6)/adenine(1519)-N(6))-dimethyltransferase RsmA [Desulfitobacteriaceae bacterium]|nr:16S rRNA (adenine(1518)-N(6)/adenine(1519)-N(6))-dimethyltransferase RsmA [Desulfitobacteriaceae bacterium]